MIALIFQAIRGSDLMTIVKKANQRIHCLHPRFKALS